MCKKTVKVEVNYELGFLKVLAGRLVDIDITTEEIRELEAILEDYYSGSKQLTVERYSNYLDRVDDLRSSLHKHYKKVQLILATLEDIESIDTEMVVEYITNPDTTIYALAKLYGKKWEYVNRQLNKYNDVLGVIYNDLDIHKMRDELNKIASKQL